MFPSYLYCLDITLGHYLRHTYSHELPFLMHALIHFLGVICFDRNELCEAWKNDGRCESDQWVNRNCLVQCNRIDICDIEAFSPTGKVVQNFLHTIMMCKLCQEGADYMH